MRRVIGVLVLASVLCCLVIGSASANRLILIPTGDILTGLKAEYTANSDGDGKVYWVNLGVSRFELEGARFDDFGADKADAISAQVSIMPETSFTPALSIGVRDISDDTDGQGALYNGQTFYVAVSKAVPVTGGIPVLFQDVKVHAGLGTGGALDGLFFGVEGKLPMGLRLGAEYDTEDWNVALSYGIGPASRARIASINGDIYYGAQFAASF